MIVYQNHVLKYSKGAILPTFLKFSKGLAALF